MYYTIKLGSFGNAGPYEFVPPLQSVFPIVYVISNGLTYFCAYDCKF